VTGVSGIVCLAAIGATTAMLWLSPAAAGDQPLPGATVESVVAVARRLNPTVAAAALDFDAAVHKIGTAGVLADPALVLEAWDVNRLGVGQRRFGIEQEVKLWGKYGLERNVAQAEADAAKFQGRATVTELIAQVVAAHGEYNAAYEAVGISTEIKRRYDEILGLLRSRYGTTSVDQQDVIKAEIEAATAEGDVVRWQGEQKSAAARLNALIGRPSLAPPGCADRLSDCQGDQPRAGAGARTIGKSDVGAGRGAKHFCGPNQVSHRPQLLPRRDARREVRAAARDGRHRRVYGQVQCAAAL
jgi:cobalt-zinc-cadmium efflux system outer membrane protein